MYSSGAADQSPEDPQGGHFQRQERGEGVIEAVSNPAEGQPRL